MRQKSKGRRRSAAQWAQLLASWDPSTKSPAEFARHLGVSRGTLAWWRWRLKDSSSLTTAGGGEALRFVQVEVAPESGVEAAGSAWEFTSAAGHTLRVQGGIDAEHLRLVLDRMTGRRAP